MSQVSDTHRHDSADGLQNPAEYQRDLGFAQSGFCLALTLRTSAMRRRAWLRESISARRQSADVRSVRVQRVVISISDEFDELVPAEIFRRI